MLVQLVWKSSESRNLVGSNWNKFKKKPPSRQRRDVLRLFKFNAAKAPQQEYSSTSHIAEKSSDTVSQELPTAASTSTTTTRSTFPAEQQQLADGQASLLSPTTTADKATPSQSLVSGHPPAWYFEKPIYDDYNEIMT